MLMPMRQLPSRAIAHEGRREHCVWPITASDPARDIVGADAKNPPRPTERRKLGSAEIERATLPSGATFNRAARPCAVVVVAEGQRSEHHGLGTCSAQARTVRGGCRHQRQHDVGRVGLLISAPRPTVAAWSDRLRPPMPIDAE